MWNTKIAAYWPPKRTSATLQNESTNHSIEKAVFQERDWKNKMNNSCSWLGVDEARGVAGSSATSREFLGRAKWNIHRLKYIRISSLFSILHCFWINYNAWKSYSRKPSSRIYTFQRDGEMTVLLPDNLCRDDGWWTCSNKSRYEDLSFEKMLFIGI